MNDTLDPILQQEEQRKLRTQLAWRLCIAATLVAGVLATLAWLEHKSAPATKLSIGPIKNQTVAPPSPLTEASPQDASTRIVPAGENTDDEPGQTETSTFSAQPAQSQLSVRQGQTTTATFTPAVTVPPMTETVSAASQPETATTTLQSSMPRSKPASVVRAPAFPAPIATSNGFIVQAGVFLHASNAEKLLGQVQKAGIPAYLETRVQIGPFLNKADAEAATRKLRQLGIEPIIRIH